MPTIVEPLQELVSNCRLLILDKVGSDWLAITISHYNTAIFMDLKVLLYWPPVSRYIIQQVVKQLKEEKGSKLLIYTCVWQQLHHAETTKYHFGEKIVRVSCGYEVFIFKVFCVWVFCIMPNRLF
jgi:hypothetical protein